MKKLLFFRKMSSRTDGASPFLRFYIYIHYYELV